MCLFQALWAIRTQADVTASSRQQHSHASVQVDPGVDTGIVKTVTALFREPNIRSTQIGTLHKGALTVLVSREKTNGWLNVIQYTSGHQGWVEARALVLHYTHHRSAETSLHRELMGTVAAPELNVVNAAGVGMFIHLDTTPETYIAPNMSKKIDVPTGVHTYNAAAPNVIPDFGSCDFLNGGRYSWTFTIAHARQSKTRIPVSQATINESKKLQVDVDARTLELRVEKQQIDTDRTVLRQQQSKWQSDSDALNALQQRLDRTSQEEINRYNGFVEALNNELTALREAERRFDAEVEAYNSNLNLVNRKKRRLQEIANLINSS